MAEIKLERLLESKDCPTSIKPNLHKPVLLAADYLCGGCGDTLLAKAANHEEGWGIVYCSNNYGCADYGVEKLVQYLPAPFIAVAQISNSDLEGKPRLREWLDRKYLVSRNENLAGDRTSARDTIWRLRGKGE